MGSSFSFRLSEKEPLSRQCINLGIYTFLALIKYVQLLPYGRNSERGNYHLVLSQQKGTCSTKHAFLSKVAEENNKQNILLYIGIYKMNNSNTPGIGNVLKEYNLEYIPEAHTYLKCNDIIYDFTRKGSEYSAFESDLLLEEQINSNQIGEYKINFHKAYLKRWIDEKSITLPFEKVWQIREICIKNLSENNTL